MSFVILAVVAFSIGGDSPPARTPSGHAGVIPVAVRVDESCKELAQPRRMPNLDALLDSLGLHNRLQALDTTGAGEPVISIMLSDQPTGHVVDVLIPSPVQDTVLRMVLASLRAAPKNAPSAFRVRVHRGRTTGIAAERSILCLPEAVGGRMGQSPVVGRVTVQGGNAPRATTVRQFTSRLRIDTNGRVADVDLGGGSGIPEIDRSVRASMESQYFRPATLDGRPVEVWFSAGKAELVR